MCFYVLSRNWYEAILEQSFMFVCCIKIFSDNNFKEVGELQGSRITARMNKVNQVSVEWHQCCWPLDCCFESDVSVAAGSALNSSTTSCNMQQLTRCLNIWFDFGLFPSDRLPPSHSSAASSSQHPQLSSLVLLLPGSPSLVLSLASVASLLLNTQRVPSFWCTHSWAYPSCTSHSQSRERDDGISASRYKCLHLLCTHTCQKLGCAPSVPS